MRFRTYVLICSLFLIVGLLPLSVKASEKEEIHENYDFNPNGVISLANVNGDVTLSVWKENKVDLHAIKTGEDVDSVKIEIQATPDRLSIETVYPKWKKNNHVKVEYELKVPAGVTLDSVENVNGDIGVTGVQGTMKVRTVNGSIELRDAASTVEADTVNGSVNATFRALPATAHVSMESVNGSFKLYLPEFDGADFSTETLNGKIRTDFPIQVSGDIGGHHMEGRIGSGGTRMRFQTVNGSVYLLKLDSFGKL